MKSIIRGLTAIVFGVLPGGVMFLGMTVFSEDGESSFPDIDSYWDLLYVIPLVTIFSILPGFIIMGICLAYELHDRKIKKQNKFLENI